MPMLLCPESTQWILMGNLIFLKSLIQARNHSSLCIPTVLLCYWVSHVWFFVTAWTAVHQAPLSIWILQEKTLECLAMPSSRGSSQPGDWIQVSWIAGRFFYHLSHQGSPRILEWVVYPFSRGTCQLRNPTGISCIAGGFLTSWATQEVHILALLVYKHKTPQQVHISLSLNS